MTDSSVGYSLNPSLKTHGVIGEQDLTDRRLILQDELHSCADSESEEDVTEAIQDTPAAEQVFYDTPTARMQSNSSVILPQHPPILLPRAQRIWEMDRVTPQCRRCDRPFTFLVRRHHCRRCGQIICDKCSLHRMRLPVEELVEDPMVSRAQYTYLATQPQRVCDNCYSIPVRQASDTLQRSDSLLMDCPVCAHRFLGSSKAEQEEHLKQCLNMNGPTVHAPRYIVYKLAKDSTQISDECPICFEEFCPGDKIARMICLCSFHRDCLANWLEKGKGCPIHYDSIK